MLLPCDISLEILDVGIDRTVESHFCRTGLRIVEKVQLVGMLNFIEVSVCDLHVRQQLAVIGVIRGFGIPTVLEHLLNAHTVVVVLEGERLSVAGHFLELATSDRTIKWRADLSDLWSDQPDFCV